jgi:hypothetical protein
VPRYLVLHIGLPKTGTTSIQRTLATNRPALRAHGFYYPRLSGGAVPQFLHRAGGSRRVGQFWRELRDEVASLPQDGSTVILSAEQCSLKLTEPDDVAALHARLVDFFTAMRVVVYLRRQDLHAASLFAQRLRLGVVEPPDLASLAAEMAPMHDFNALLARWSEVFGLAAMVPRLYERDLLPGGNVVRDFLEVCGLDMAWAAQHAAAEINPSMNLEGQTFLLGIGGWLLRRSGGAAIDSADWTKLAALATRCCPGRGWRPCQAEAAAYLAGFADSNEAVRQRWFPARTSLFNMDMRDLPEVPLLPAAQPALETAYAAIMDQLGTSPIKFIESGKKRTARSDRPGRDRRGARRTPEAQ